MSHTLHIHACPGKSKFAGGIKEGKISFEVHEIEKPCGEVTPEDATDESKVLTLTFENRDSLRGFVRALEMMEQNIDAQGIGISITVIRSPEDFLKALGIMKKDKAQA
jgi:hypothetical protein